jgi:hypothetical protein
MRPGGNSRELPFPTRMIFRLSFSIRANGREGRARVGRAERAVTGSVAGIGDEAAGSSARLAGSGPRGLRAARPRVLWGIGLGAAAVLLFWCYLGLSRTAAVNSDAAGQVLQGWQMLHGNPLLRGWFLSDVSFYTFEVPLDGLVATVRGLRPDTVHVTAAIVYTLLVLSAALLARGRAHGPEGAVRALVAAGVLLAPGFNPGAHVLLLAPDHTGVGVPVLLTLLLVDRARERWWLPVVACMLLTWAQVDDPVATYACAVPLAAVCAVRAAAALLARRASRQPAATRPVPWYDAALAAAAAASYGLTWLVLSAIRGAGGFYVHPVIGGTGLAAWSAIPRQLLWTGQNIAYLFGANYFGQSSPLDAAFGYVHLAGVAVALCGFVIGVRGLFFRLGPAFGPGPAGRADRVTQALTGGVAVTLAAGAFGTHMAPIQGAHEIAIVLPLGAVLGGRMIGPWLAGAGATSAGAAGLGVTGRTARMTVASALVVAGAGYLASLGYYSSRPAAPAETQDLAGWLAAHRLTYGLAGYWDAEVSTLASGGRVMVAPVADGGTYEYLWECMASWYDPALSSANFVVTVSYPPSAATYAQPAVVRAWYGRPARTYHFQQYTIMVYNYNLLLRVRQPVVGRL